MQTKIKHCTSCGSDQIVVAGQKFLCRPCNIVYEVTDTGTKVLETNPLAKHEQRLANLERSFEILQKAGQGGQPAVEILQKTEQKGASGTEPALPEDGPEQASGPIDQDEPEPDPEGTGGNGFVSW